MGSKPTKEELIKQCEKLNLSTEGKVEDLRRRLQEHKDAQKSPQMSLDTPIDNQPSAETAKKTNYFIHLKSANFLYYLNYAVIVPVSLLENDIYRNENRRKDVLTDYPNHIIISKKPIGEFSQDDVMVEVDGDALPSIRFSDEIFYTFDPIPISRIIGVIFPSEESKKKFLADINIYPDSFFPEKLCSVFSKTGSSLNTNSLPEKLPENDGLFDWTKKLDAFDRILGMFSFMRNSGIIYSVVEGTYYEYTSSYLYALNCIYPQDGQQFEREAHVFKYMLRIKEPDGQNFQRVIFEKIIDWIYLGKAFNFGTAITLLSESLIPGSFTKEDEVLVYAASDVFHKMNRQEIVFRDLLINDLFRRNYALFGLMFLCQYSNVHKSHTDKQAVRNLIIANTNVIPRQTAEYLLALLGLYYGYKNMVKADTNLSLNDPVLSELCDVQQTIKIKDLNYVDRIVIDSCFEFAATSKIGSYHLRLSHFSNTKVDIRANVGRQKDVLYFDRSFKKFDTTISVIERQSKSQQLINTILKEFPSSIPSKSATLYYLLNKFGIDKRLLLQYILDNTSKIDWEELQKLVEVDMSQLNRK